MRNIRIVMAKPGLDGHDRGIKILAAAYRDAGMEVIYLGLRQTPEMIVSAALQEDADVIALSSLNNAHMTIFPKVLELMKEKEIDDVVKDRFFPNTISNSENKEERTQDQLEKEFAENIKKTNPLV